MSLGVEEAKRRAPGMADQRHLGLAVLRAQVIDHRVQVGQVPGDGQAPRIGLRIE